MKNKKSIMVFSALQIIIFHLWICTPGRIGIELFFKQTAYIGVDIFFLLSAYSLAQKTVDNYGRFVLSRFKAVYLKFILFAIVAFVYEKWEPVYFLKVITGVDLFEKGGGAFLWFLPAIMLFYLFFPLLQKCDNKNRIVTLIVIVLVWAGVAYIVTKHTDNNQIFIYWNRIPVFLTGYYLANYKDRLDNTRLKLIQGIILTVTGTYILYKFAYSTKLQFPFTDMFYVTVIPASIGYSLLVSFIPEIKPIKWLGSSTLEMYAMQMIFGYDMANKLLMLTKNIFITNICSVLFVLISATAIHYLYEFIYKRIVKSGVQNQR